MSKSALYGILSAFIVLTASVSYFFPVISEINGLFNATSEESSSIAADEKNESNTVETQNVSADESMASYIENPSVQINGDSVERITNDISTNMPSKSEMLQGEVPANKSF